MTAARRKALEVLAAAGPTGARFSNTTAKGPRVKPTASGGTAYPQASIYWQSANWLLEHEFARWVGPIGPGPTVHRERLVITPKGSEALGAELAKGTQLELLSR